MQVNGRFLLDTNIIIALFAGDHAIHIRILKADEVFVPSIALGELYFGASKSHRIQENIMLIDRFAKDSAILACDAETARRYGEIKGHLKEKGRLIPENDIWIAAIAQQNDLVLVTRDTHFISVTHIKKETW
jgi:tRNA(fMet)-specific endonuclease VapC